MNNRLGANGLAGLAVAMVVVGATSARGWGDEGHRIIGEMAWRQLDRAARSEVTDLLASEPARFRRLSDAGTWADAIRSDERYDWARPHHYVNVREGQWTYDEARDCGAEGCVVSALRAHRVVLEDPTASREQKTESLKFFAHLMGDLHQPLHVGNRRDLGGNKIEVRTPRWWPLPPESSNLHREWDTTLVERTGPRGDRRVRRLMRQLSRAEVEAWREGAMEDWANDTRAVFMRLGLADTPPGTLVDRRYLRRHQAVVDEQLKKAGVRLAAALNQVFSPRRD